MKRMREKSIFGKSMLEPILSFIILSVSCHLDCERHLWKQFFLTFWRFLLNKAIILEMTDTGEKVRNINLRVTFLVPFSTRKKRFHIRWVFLDNNQGMFPSSRFKTAGAFRCKRTYDWYIEHLIFRKKLFYKYTF